MNCSKCGYDNPTGSKFCIKCGTKLEEANKPNIPAMKYCIKCGKHIPADSQICPICKESQGNTNPIPEKKPMLKEKIQSTKVNVFNASPENKKRNTIIGIVVAALTVCCILVGAVVSVKSSTIDLNDYLIVHYGGRNGYGYVWYEVDEEKLQEDYGEKITKGINKNNKNDPFAQSRLAYGNDWVANALVTDCVYGSFDVEDGLSDGDVVKFTWDCDKDTAQSRYGMILKCDEKEFTIEGLDNYIDSASQISDDCLEEMKTKAEENFKRSNYIDSYSKLESLEYVGNYVLKIDDIKKEYANNIVYVIYKAEIRNEYKNDDDKYNKVTEVYWWTSFQSLYVNSDGETIIASESIHDTENTFTVDSGIKSWGSNQTWTYDGYKTLDELYDSSIAEPAEKYGYTIEDNTKTSNTEKKDS